MVTSAGRIAAGVILLREAAWMHGTQPQQFLPDVLGFFFQALD
jgi:hypothetical protein